MFHLLNPIKIGQLNMPDFTNKNEQPKKHKGCREQNFIGESIREFRISQNMTQKELAELCGVSQAMISAYENGLHEPYFYELLGISDALKIDPLAIAMSAFDKLESLRNKDQPSTEKYKKQAEQARLHMTNSI